jgi:putative oxidoreductase
MPAALSFFWFGGILEFFGGLLLLAGLFTRCVAFVLAGEMAVAYWLFHAPKSFFPALNGGDAAILYCFIFLYLVFAGPGPWSIDRTRRPPLGTPRHDQDHA